MDRSNNNSQKIPVKLHISVADDSNDSAAISVKSSAPLAKSNNKIIYVFKTIWTLLSILIGNYHQEDTAQAKPAPKTSGRQDEPTIQKQTVEIRIVLPFVFKSPHKQLASKFQRASKRDRVLSVVGIICVITLVVLALLSTESNKPASANAKLDTPSLTKGSPSYHTILPAGKNISELGGWTRISPPGTSPVYTYVDSIKGVKINVSEQPLPGDLYPNTDDQIARVAHDFSANDKVMAGSTPFYVGTSIHGPQSVILAKSGLLILIKSESIIRDSEWAKYIQSLK